MNRDSVIKWADEHNVRWIDTDSTRCNQSVPTYRLGNGMLVWGARVDRSHDTVDLCVEPKHTLADLETGYAELLLRDKRDEDTFILRIVKRGD